MSDRRFMKVMVAALFTSTALFAQSGDFSVSGRVVDGSGVPIPNATVNYVSLAKRLSWDHSRTNGTFGPSGAVSNPEKRTPGFSVAGAGPVTVDFFDVKGTKVGSLHYDKMDKGVYSITPIAARLSKAVYVVKVKSGASVQYLTMVNTGANGAQTLALQGATGAAPFAKTAAVAVDTIRVGKSGYVPVKVPISSYSQIVGDVPLAQTIDIEGKVNTMLASMTLAEKAGQPVQVIFPGTANVTNYKLGTVFGGGSDGPGTGTGSGTATQWSNFANTYMNASLATDKKIPVLFCLDVVHGFGKCYGATILPHNIALGCTWSPRMVEKAYRVCAIESRGCGINMAFGPCIAVPRNDRWGRVYEGFSETPDLTKVMAKAAVLGFQTWDMANPLSVCACTKHFAGDGGTANGQDRGNTSGDDATLRAIHLPGYIAAIEAGTGSIMASFSTWNGVRMSENKPLLTDWLKVAQKWDGFVNGDYDSHTTGQGASSPQNCINAGLDVPMSGDYNEPGAITTLTNLFTGLYNGGSAARVDDDVKRLLRIKYRMNLFNGTGLVNSQVTQTVGSAEHRAVAREAVRRSLVCLKNPGGILPLPKTAKITLVGNHAQDIGLQCGGWTMGWQGSTGNITVGTTIRQGVEAVVGAGNVTWNNTGATIAGDYAVVVIGEQPYAEMNGDRTDLTIPLASLVTAAKTAAGTKKLICIMITGRPMDVSTIINNCDVLIAAWLPGTEAGNGIADVLFGDYDFTGKLSISWPKNTAQEPINYGDATYAPLFEYDYGLKANGTQLAKGIYNN
jgi:beta-glucosidase